ncbi:MAG: HsdR family type I site-specific deoxyribonuclease, partial [Thermoplasmata archaeon]|nr:HsdR family type I site-specific deoxyribonuclease [Thermoplasmata archaeon]
ICGANEEYKGVELDDDILEGVVSGLRLTTGASVEGSRRFLRVLKMGWMSVDPGRRQGPRTVPFIDYSNLENNEFIVSNQVVFKGVNNVIRADVVLFVNGIPLVLVECKDVASERGNWRNAFRQIKRYERTVPELFKYVQVNVALEDTAHYFPSIPWEVDESRVKAHTWGGGDLSRVLEPLRPGVLLDMIRNFVFIREEGGGYTKILPRHMQYHAANKIYERVVSSIRENGPPTGGLIWHWQGSGKTLTMAFAAYKLFMERTLERPTIFFISDREEIEGEMTSTLKSLDMPGGVSFERVSSIKDLKEIILHDGGRGKRGMFVLLVQKFGGGDRAIKIEDLGDVPISDRKNIICFVDEAHRTQYGVLASRMRAVFKNASFFAFTGTPISKGERDTFARFSGRGELYLHRYFIEDSLRDGYTVPIAYLFRKEKDVLLREEHLRGIINTVFRSSESETEAAVKRRLKPMEIYMLKEERMREIAADIVEHFMSRPDKRFKGMVVTQNRKACVLYKRYIDEYMKEHYPDIDSEGFSEVVMSYDSQRDGKDEEIDDYRKSLEERFGDTKTANREIKARFKREGEPPYLVIVTDMLLTGYNAPVLQFMYLDKILAGHNLLQAIARTNRPYRDGKGYGMIIDYVGLFKRFREALEAYYEMDDTDVILSAEPAEALEEAFGSLAEEMRALLGEAFSDSIEDIARGHRRSLYTVVGELARDEEKSERFLSLYRDYRKIYDALGPSVLKAEERTQTLLKAFTSVYVTLKKVLYGEGDPGIVEKYLSEVREAVERNIEFGGLKEENGFFTVDEDFLSFLESKDKEEGIVEMTAILHQFVASVAESSAGEVVYSDIVESVKNTLEKWKKRESGVEETYQRMLDHFRAIGKEEEIRRRLSMDTRTYMIFVILNKMLKMPIEDAESLAREIIGNLTEGEMLFDGWYDKKDSWRLVRSEVRMAISPSFYRREGYSEKTKKLLDSAVERIVHALAFQRG